MTDRKTAAGVAEEQTTWTAAHAALRRETADVVEESEWGAVGQRASGSLGIRAFILGANAA